MQSKCAVDSEGAMVLKGGQVMLFAAKRLNAFYDNAV